MKKTLATLVAFLAFGSSQLFAVGLGSDALAKPDKSKSDWDFGFNLYARTVLSAGAGLYKTENGPNRGGVNGTIRIRPGMVATNGNFLFGMQLGTDMYMGTISGTDTPGGSNSTGFGLGEYGRELIQLRKLYMGYTWDNGLYTIEGVQTADLPYLISDTGAGFVWGWKNSSVDISAFYFQLAQNSLFTKYNKSGVYGLKVDMSFDPSFTISPYVAALWQGARLASDAGAMQYSGGAKFLGHTGVFIGLETMYTAPFGLYVKLDGILAGGKNKSTSEGISQTRAAGGALIAVGYSLEQILKAELFADIRSGSSNTDRSTNYSINGALIENDATQAPLYIMYNNNCSRSGFHEFGFTDGQGYAFSDRGAFVFGGDATFDLAMFEVGFALGYGLYSAKVSGAGSAIGFEGDFTLAYKMTNEAHFKLETGLLVPGQGLKDSYSTGGTHSKMPWMTNLVFEYSM